MASRRRSKVVGEGCEPYAMDFGDREYGEWLERWLTPAELEERARYSDIRWRLAPVGWQGWSLLVYRARRVAFWPILRYARRRIKRLDAIAEQRGGPPPGPSWKIRHVWGTASVE